ncbi:MAG TPA: hypothetical protein VF794_35415 [Archangium sp.]|jgi:hypothetical protein|uniref:hypothetical protein n=1 Tax=Archangium sp. TaxID=1872627 RepID=UPI002ED8AFB4
MRTHNFDSSKSDNQYGRQHARTAELYRKKREARALAEQKSATTAAPQEQLSITAEPPQEPMGGEAPPMEMMEQPANSTPAEAPHEGLRDKAQHAVASVIHAAKEAAHKAHPLQGAKKLASEVVSGAVKVARQVSARRVSSEKAKGAGKKR